MLPISNEANDEFLIIRLQGRGERSYDIFSRLLRERVIMLHGPVSLTASDFILFLQYSKPSAQIRDDDSTLIVAQLLFLEAEDSTKPIHLYINSPGGSVTAGLAIYDTVSLFSDSREYSFTLYSIDAGGWSQFCPLSQNSLISLS